MNTREQMFDDEAAYQEANRQADARDAAAHRQELRDIFAGVALLGMVQGGVIPNSEQSLAETAYRVADAMMVKRGGPCDPD